MFTVFQGQRQSEKIALQAGQGALVMISL